MAGSRTKLDPTENRYLDEKELFILYFLSRKKCISTFESVFSAGSSNEVHYVTNDTDADAIKRLTDKITEKQRHREHLRRTPFVASYLLQLGNDFDEKGYEVTTNAEYSLVEGGALCANFHGLMNDYLEDTPENRASLDKYKELNADQLIYLKKLLDGADLDSSEFSKYAFPPLKEYTEAIVEKKADKDFIELVNRLIRPYDGGAWNTDNVRAFIELYYEHNKAVARKKATLLFEDDAQTSLAKNIFESADFMLSFQDASRLKNFVEEYIQKFKDDALDGTSRNGLTGTYFNDGLSAQLPQKYFGYKKQKEMLLSHIQTIHEKFQRDDLNIGNINHTPEYIGDLSNETLKITLDAPNEETALFLFVHAMIALENEGHFDIEGLSYGTLHAFDLYDRGYQFRIRLKNKVAASAASTRFFESYDEIHRVLKIAGIEIELAKKGRETDAALLMKLLANKEQNEWVYLDEVLAEFGYAESRMPDAPKNKLYDAGRKINTTVALKAHIDDFIEFGTTRARINPKYLAVGR